jgi:hypothetical protein
MSLPDRPPTHVASRQLVKRILVILLIGSIVGIGAASLAGLMFWRQYRHKERFLESIQEVNTEQAERNQVWEEAHRRLSAGDFDALEATARELRTTRAVFANGTWKLRVFYEGLGGPVEGWTESEWRQAFDQTKEWVHERPTSIAARLALANLWIDYGWVARGSGWSEDVSPEQHAIFEQRIEQATQVMKDAHGVEERCPHRAPTLLRLALVGSVARDDELKVFEQAVRDDPDYQPAYTAHLRYMQPRWHGAPGDWERAAAAILKLPGGKEKYARAIWHLHAVNSWDRQLVSWPHLKQGFTEMRARYPDSSEIKSATCLFASYYRDEDEARAMLAALGGRMDTSVWHDRNQFAQVYLWATFEQSQMAGGDPLARFFAWVMGS